MTQDPRTRLRRIVTQHLESLRRAGLSSLPRLRSEEDVPPADSEVSTQTSQVKVTTSPSSQTVSLYETPSSSTAPVKPAGQSLFPETNASLSGTTSVSDQPPCSLTRSERLKKLEVYQNRVAACVRCTELAETRNRTAFGVGDPEAKIMFVGEAPGVDEDRQGEPFVGRAGQLLNRIITACRMTREEIYICNILKCRPPGNRNPVPQEAANCREYLDEQIAIVDPEYIVCWGSVAARHLLDMTESIGRMRGKFYRLGRAKVLCTYHPSYLLRNPSAKKEVWKDMKFLMRDMGIELDAPGE